MSVLTGPISTGPKAWPSAWRGTPPRTPTGIEVDAGLDPLEKNGFTIIDFTDDRIEGQMFSWKMDELEDRLDSPEAIPLLHRASDVKALSTIT